MSTTAPPVPDHVLTLLRDPATGGRLEPDARGALSVEGDTRVHPVVDGIPVVLPPGATAPLDDEPERRGVRGRASALARRIAHLPPSITRNVGSRENYAQLAELLRGRGTRTNVLVIGGAIDGIGLDALRAAPHVDLLETDVYVGPRTQLVCDAHALPFADATFDAVVCQGVFSVLCDPVRAAEEIHRVLAPGGLVYSETAFLQGVCNGGLDFTRWTLTGHRRLLRGFAEIRAGAHNGPGMALAWQISYFLMAFAGHSKPAHAALRRIASLLTFPLTWLDPWLVRRPGGLDGAAGTFFLGERVDEPASDAAIVGRYEGAVHPPSDPRPL